MDDPEAVVAAQLEAFNARDIEAFVRCYAPDAQILRFPSGDLIAEGHAEIRQRVAHYEKDRFFAPDIETIKELITEQADFPPSIPVTIW